MGQIATDVDRGDGNQAQARILDLTLNKQRQFALHLIADTLGTTEFFGHKFLPD